MKASILINSYNYARYLREAIDSALEQDYPDTEVIVVDDGSTDESPHIITAYGARITPVLKTNGGQASCFNAGFAAATGDIILLLDADDRLLPGKVSTLARIYCGSQEIGWCVDHVSTSEDFKPVSDPRVTFVDKRGSMRKGAFPTIPAPTSGLSFRRSCLASILPMPLASDIVLSDNYLKFAAAYLAPGAIVEDPLTFQRLHGANRYTAAAGAQAKRAAIMIETGVELARKYPGLRQIGVKLVAGGLAEGSVARLPAQVAAVMRRAGSVFGALSMFDIVIFSLGSALKRVVNGRGPASVP